MDLSDEFEVALPLEDAWRVLTDLGRVAPCLPGAQLDEVEGDEYRGKVRVKVGPITVEYRGRARFVSRDDATHAAELRADGRETRGQGNASANVRVALASTSPDRTRVSVDTSLDVSGRVAQLGRGALADVSTKLLRQFVENLESDLASDILEQISTEPDQGDKAEPGPGEESSGAPQPPPREPRSAPAEPISALRLVGPTLLKRLSPVVAFGVLFVVVRRLRRRAR